MLLFQYSSDKKSCDEVFVTNDYHESCLQTFLVLTWERFFLRLNYCLLGLFIFTVVNTKKRPAITIVPHTAWARALSAIVIVFPHINKFLTFFIKKPPKPQNIKT